MKKMEFSKILLIQESVLVWISTICFIILAFLCIRAGYFGDFAWLTALCTALWAAYGVSQAFYYKKAMAENTKGGIKYESLKFNSPTEDDDEEAMG